MMLTGIICTLVGVAILVVPRKLAKSFVTYQNKTFGFHFGEGWVTFTFVVNVIVGATFAILGLLTLSGVVK